MSEIVEAMKQAGDNPENVGGDTVKKDNSADEIAGLKNQISNLTNQLSELKGTTQTLASLNRSSPEPEDDADDEDFSEDEDVKTLVTKIVKTQVQEERKRDRKERLKQEWDSKADKDFPLLKDSTSDFYRDVGAELRGSPDRESPDAVYNAASRVVARYVQQGKRGDYEKKMREIRAKDGFLEGSSPRPPASPKSVTLTEDHKYLASRLGIDPEKMKKSMERRAERKTR